MSNPRPHHLNIAGQQVAHTAAFYREMLGLIPAELPRDMGNYNAAIIVLQDEQGYQYHFIPDEPDFGERQGWPVNPLGGGHLAFRVDDIAAIRAKLDAAGESYSDVGDWFIKGWHQLFCKDPEGRVIEFHQVLHP